MNAISICSEIWPKYALASFLLGVSVLFASSCICAAEVVRTDANQTAELWEGKALTASFRVGMCFARNGKAHGVLILRHRNGQEDPYHLYGELKDGEFFLSHSSGHRFSGKLISNDAMEGKVKLANGLSLSLKGKRIHNVSLAAPDCAPLAQ